MSSVVALVKAGRVYPYAHVCSTLEIAAGDEGRIVVFEKSVERLVKCRWAVVATSAIRRQKKRSTTGLYKANGPVMSRKRLVSAVGWRK